MLLIHTSIILYGLGRLFYNIRPKEINHFYGFRSKKSKKNAYNWDKAQLMFSQLMQKYFGYSSLGGIFFLVFDVLCWVIHHDTLLAISLSIQGVIIGVLLLLIYIQVNSSLL
ncbi:SdpI family protein [Staphylococcus sp. 17KM0847]|uniref:SdpI family protein n=1 Tax=Staphylococcus sp. 17KM0847 TaxID=2583989 RepID=UPI0015DCB74F|nr:SdpI family protein [Staphylococcus sp. 17KM0847]QLK85259.1 SdpI family protein [Staphylococcus sp. 17KM0847]